MYPLSQKFHLWRGTGDGSPLSMRAGEVLEVGERRAERGIPKLAGTERNEKNVATLHKRQEAL